MKYKKAGLIISSLFCSIAGFSGAVKAQSIDGGGWYLGAGVGRSNATGLSGIDTTLAGAGISSTSTVGDTDTAWKLLAGYQVNKYFGVEGGYGNLGQYNVNSTVSAPGAGVGTATWKANNVWSLAGIGYIPIVDKLSAFGKVGFAYSKVSFNYSDTVGDAISNSKSTTSPLYGVGMKYDFGNNVSVRGEFERYQNVGDSNITGQSSINVFSLGLLYRFGS